MTVYRTTLRAPSPRRPLRREPTPAEALRALLKAREPQLAELRRRLAAGKEA